MKICIINNIEDMKATEGAIGDIILNEMILIT
jgi:hypothetical protein